MKSRSLDFINNLYHSTMLLWSMLRFVQTPVDCHFLSREVDELVRFPGQKPRKQLTYAAKQLIAREVSELCLKAHERPESE